MKLQFKKQSFQLSAVDAVTKCFEGQPRRSDAFQVVNGQDLLMRARDIATGVLPLAFEEDLMERIGYRNAPLELSPLQLLRNIQQVQRDNNLQVSDKLEFPKYNTEGCHLTIEMETGTGKTYTYIRTMYELYRQFGWSKFLVIVPSIAIREGVFKTFEITQDHFQEIYGHKIRAYIYNSANPQHIDQFASSGNISVMVINTQAFNARGKDARRIYMELDDFSTRRPIEVIAQTNPVLIIDEPQSVDGEKTLESMQDFHPLFTLRYSATHKQEYNKVFRLDALDAYNQKLVKKIQVKGINIRNVSGADGYLYLEQVVLGKGNPQAMVEFEKRTSTGIKRVRQKLKAGANLFQLSGEMPQYEHCILQHIDGYLNKIEINGQELFAGEMIGAGSEGEAFRRIQIRETILSHLQREKQLFIKGIKVLSLFFIDAVEKYRIYPEGGGFEPGMYARVFEEEYQAVVQELLQEEQLLPEYADYLRRDAATSVHDGYFSLDKQKRLTDPVIRKGKKPEDVDSDDKEAFDLIMKNKERLLDFKEPVRFLFSHSALKEGWDNPNVFQICALKGGTTPGYSTHRRRQEVGRGMRLCVNQHGIRQDFETVGEEVHDINRLTIIAAESYEQFAEGLQTEIAETLKGRPVKVSVDFITGRIVTDAQGNQLRLDEDTARKLNKLLYKNDILDDDDQFTEYGRSAVEEGAFPLPVNLEPFRDSVQLLLLSVFTPSSIEPENERHQAPVALNPNFHKQEFQELWKRISHKTIYEVAFNTEKLITESIQRLNNRLFVAESTYEVKSGSLEKTTKEQLEQGEAFSETGRATHKLLTKTTYSRYDVVGEIVRYTNLTRKTIVRILKAIKLEKFNMVAINPEAFIANTSHLINETKASLIIHNIVYHKTDEKHDAAAIFTNDRLVIRNQQQLKKHIYDYLTTDSDTEASFAEALEKSAEVSVYAKLPKSFHITTPIANYSPDWAIVFDEKKVRHIYFVAETKGTEHELELRGIEDLKIHCAEKHFKAIAGKDILYSFVKTYDKLLEIVQVK
ncbi:type III restriction-modification system endonuclease [Parasegetibacter sp. NRK P23]|uniref:type III restriction-modification system endonuclease n=1 Tax=Parasegetibacter sp. NRK P23 TaxID=2942999 RepID=UPI00204398A3|nr:DEAD/DEAH box helicase family protein [Parasegetibacter sp. NRK P23]MCM5529749.1 DEAD/DEAH box helicase family protein [Parasegetibacter sp. NRK P23]